MPKYRNANTNAEDFCEYTYAIQILGELLSAGLISQAEYDEVKKAYMDEYKVQNDWVCRRRIVLNTQDKPNRTGSTSDRRTFNGTVNKKSNSVRADG